MGSTALVPPEVVWPSHWHECADATCRLLAGDHWEFLRAPSALVELIVASMRAGR